MLLIIKKQTIVLVWMIYNSTTEIVLKQCVPVCKLLLPLSSAMDCCFEEMYPLKKQKTKKTPFKKSRSFVQAYFTITLGT